MWKVVSASSTVWHVPSHSAWFNLVVLVLLMVATLSSCGQGLPLDSVGANSGGMGIRSGGSSSPSTDVQSTTTSRGVDLAQLHNFLREALRYMSKMNKAGAPAEDQQKVHGISGQVNVRYPRSEVGDVAFRLVALQDLDRKFGAKARPRFGKRNEVTQENFIPIYGDEEQPQRERDFGAKGDRPVALPSAPFYFIT